MTTADRVVFLFDVDDTLLDNDAAQNDYLDHVARRVGPHAAQRYWTIFRGLYDLLDYGLRELTGAPGEPAGARG